MQIAGLEQTTEVHFQRSMKKIAIGILGARNDSFEIELTNFLFAFAKFYSIILLYYSISVSRFCFAIRGKASFPAGFFAAGLRVECEK